MKRIHDILKACNFILAVETERTKNYSAAALDYQYEVIDKMILRKEYDDIDRIFSYLHPDECDLTLAIGYLTATLSIRNLLPHRTIFARELKTYIKTVLKRDYKPLLNGLF